MLCYADLSIYCLRCLAAGCTRVLVGCFHSRYTLYGLALTDLEEAGKPLGPRRELTSDFFFGFPRSGAAESSMAFRQQKRDGQCWYMRMMALMQSTFSLIFVPDLEVVAVNG